MDRLRKPDYAPSAVETVFGARPVLLGRGAQLPRFEDEKWSLAAIQPQVHLKAAVISFRNVPEAFKLNAKEVIRALIREEPAGGAPPLSASTILDRHFELKHFFDWLVSGQIEHLDEVTSATLAKYRESLTSGGKDIPYKVGRALNALYEHRDLVTRGLRVDPSGLLSPRRRPTPQAENATPRIPEEVLVPLAVWAHRWVAVFADDVISAKTEFESTRAQSFKKMKALSLAEGHESLRATLAEYADAGRPLPGKFRDGVLTVNMAHLARQSSCVMDVVQRIAAADVQEAVDLLGLDPELPLRHVPVAALDSQPWLDAIPFWDVEALVNNLVASCYILIALFSGMRDDEIKHLERGCLRTESFQDGRTSRHWVRSLAFKSEGDSFGVPASWRVGQYATQAIEVLERLQPNDEQLLFARFHLQKNARPESTGANATRTANGTNSDLNALVTWVNRYCADRARTDVIPTVAGDTWNLTTRQFRRTLAWFIARRPGGSIAGAMQFRHLSVHMFEGYAGTSASGFRAEVEGEQALMRGEHLLAMIDRHEHEELAGPAADSARLRFDRFDRAAAVFGGIVVESPTQMKRLMEVSDPAIYTSELVTCVFDPDRALCLRRPGDGRPDLARCDPFRCANVALTKNNIAGWGRVVADIDAVLTREQTLPPYVASRLKDARARASRRFLDDGEAP